MELDNCYGFFRVEHSPGLAVFGDVENGRVPRNQIRVHAGQITCRAVKETAQ